MKNSVNFLGGIVRLIGSRVLPAAAIGVLVFGISSAYAQTLPKPTANMNSLLVCSNSESNNGIPVTGDLANPFSRECGVNPLNPDSTKTPVVANWGTLGKTTYYAQSTISSFKFPQLATDGSGSVVGGRIDGVGRSYMNGYSKNAARGSAGGNLKYYFNIVRANNPPFSIPTIPILFTARGIGSIDMGHGRIDASVVLGVWGAALPSYFPSNLFKIGYEGKPYKAWFGDSANTGRSVTVDLPVNAPQQPYQVQISGNALAYSPSVTTLNIKDDWSTVSVYVDSIISFDQATFNARCTQQGKTSFNLSDCYRLELIK